MLTKTSPALAAPVSAGAYPVVMRNERQLWFSSFHLSEANLSAYVREMRRRRLAFLEGYPSTLYILASYLRRRGERLPLRAVFSSSETLHAVQREALTAAFECPIFDFYGLAERVVFAGECEAHEGKHLFDEYGITEVVDDAGAPVPPGQRGWLTGTTLWNRGMPLLRYRTSDMTALLPELFWSYRPERASQWNSPSA